MRHALVCGMALVGVVAGAGAQDEPVVLKRADLEKLVGTWRLTADPKEGWRGTARVTVGLYPADGKAADFARLLYDFGDVAGQQAEGVEHPSAVVFNVHQTGPWSRTRTSAAARRSS